ncbi:MAG: hypothetical protein JWN23_1537 [Rhodocyclales bacterium]|nr:hypothetical protein [Rhodocyclales bacterium]
MASLKPDLPDVGSPEFFVKLKMIIQIMTGRRKNKIAVVPIQSADAAGSAPTKAEFDALRADVIETRTKLTALIARFDD